MPDYPYSDPSYVEELIQKRSKIPFIQLDIDDSFVFGNPFRCPFSDGIPHLIGGDTFLKSLGDTGLGVKVNEDFYYIHGKEAYCLDKETFQWPKKPGHFLKGKPFHFRVVWVNRSTESRIDIGRLIETEYPNPETNEPIPIAIQIPLSLRAEGWDTLTLLRELKILPGDEAKRGPLGSTLYTMEQLSVALNKSLAQCFVFGLRKGVFDKDIDGVYDEASGRYVFAIPSPEEAKAMDPVAKTRAAQQVRYLFADFGKRVDLVYGGKRPGSDRVIRIAGWDNPPLW